MSHSPPQVLRHKLVDSEAALRHKLVSHSPPQVGEPLSATLLIITSQARRNRAWNQLMAAIVRDRLRDRLRARVEKRNNRNSAFTLPSEADPMQWPWSSVSSGPAMLALFMTFVDATLPRVDWEQPLCMVVKDWLQEITSAMVGGPEELTVEHTMHVMHLIQNLFLQAKTLGATLVDAGIDLTDLENKEATIRMLTNEICQCAADESLRLTAQQDHASHPSQDERVHLEHLAHLAQTSAGGGSGIALGDMSRAMAPRVTESGASEMLAMPSPAIVDMVDMGFQLVAMTLLPRGKREKKKKKAKKGKKKQKKR